MAFLSGVLAHAAPIDYRFPLPVWVYALGAGLVVLVSAPAAAAGVGPADARTWRSRNFYGSLRRLHLGAVGLAIASLLLVMCFVGGAAALTDDQAKEFLENPATVLIWVDFWVGLGLVSLLIGNVWDFISPLNALARLLDRVLAGSTVARREYPSWLGQWPAVALVLLWSWAELVWPRAKEPDALMFFVTIYFVATLAATTVWGAEDWLANGELFTVFARTFARCAPLEFEPQNPDRWLQTAPAERVVRLRPYGAGLRERAAAPAGSGAFVVALLATVVFDGFSRTKRFTDVQSWFYDRSLWWTNHFELLSTIVMVATVVVFVLVFLAIMFLVGLREGGLRATASRYAPTLVPIAGVYFIAHYWTYLVIAGQATLGALVDPLGRDWNPGGLGEYPLATKFIPGGFVWWSQILLIIVGHVAAIVAAHRVAVRLHARARTALLVQAPVIVLMVGYTIAGLWVLAQALAPRA